MDERASSADGSICISDSESEPPSELGVETRRPFSAVLLEVALRIAKSFAHLLVSNLGLATLVGAYCVGGAYMFQAIELEAEMERRTIIRNISMEIEEKRVEIASVLASAMLIPNDTLSAIELEAEMERRTIIRNISIEIEEKRVEIASVLASAMLIPNDTLSAIELEAEMERRTIIRNISIEIEEKRVEIASVLASAMLIPNDTLSVLFTEYNTLLSIGIDAGYDGSITQPEDEDYGWSFASALLFTVTIVTTIGYGHVGPKTATGQLLIIPYSLLGVPLMLMFLAEIGDAMATAFRTSYAKGCCYICWLKRRRNYAHHKDIFIQFQSVKDRPPSRWTSHSSQVGDETGAKGAPSGDIADIDIESKDGNDEDVEGQDVADEVRRWSLISVGTHFVETEDIDEASMNIPVTLSIMVIFTYILLGTVLFAAWNGWTWVESAYFSFVTLSTIGFGDYVPGLELGTLWGNFKSAVSTFYIVVGLAVLSMCFNLMMEEIISKFKWLAGSVGFGGGDTSSSEPKTGNNDDDDDKAEMTDVNEPKGEDADLKTVSTDVKRFKVKVSPAPDTLVNGDAIMVTPV